MSWTLVGPYFEDRLLAQGLTLWNEPFGVLNLPADIMDGSFQVQLGDFLGHGLNMHTLESTVDVTCRILKKGFVETNVARAELVATAMSAVQECLRPSLRLTTGIKNVSFNSMAITPFSLDNDNVLLAELVFRARVILDVPT